MPKPVLQRSQKKGINYSANQIQKLANNISSQEKLTWRQILECGDSIYANAGSTNQEAKTRELITRLTRSKNMQAIFFPQEKLT